MILELVSSHGHKVEFNVEPNRPSLNICEVEEEGIFYPWHATWNRLKLKFIENVKTIKTKMLEFYKADKPVKHIRYPLQVNLKYQGECWELKNCFVVNFLDTIELDFESVNYKEE